MHIFKLEQFEGPLDLLLNLIEEKKLDVSEISLANVADQYLEFLKSAERKMPLYDIADFLVIASRLVLIKSRSLLPDLAITEEEEEAIYDLEARLERYKKFKAAAKDIQRITGRGSVMIAREFFLGFKEFLPPKNSSLSLLERAMRNVIESFEPAPEIPKETIKIIVSFEKKINAIKERVLKEAFRMNDALQSSERIEIIVTFLAILELSKQKFIVTEQHGIFSEIMVKQFNTI